MLRWLLLLVAMAASLGLPPLAHGQAGAREPRLALVIANGNYRGFDRLSATFDDGERISAALSATGFFDGSGSGAVRTRRDLQRRRAAPPMRRCGTEWRSLGQLLRPVEGVDEDAERVLAQGVGGARWPDHDRQDRRPALGGGEAAVLIPALGPGDAKAVG